MTCYDCSHHHDCHYTVPTESCEQYLAGDKPSKMDKFSTIVIVVAVVYFAGQVVRWLW